MTTSKPRSSRSEGSLGVTGQGLHADDALTRVVDTVTFAVSLVGMLVGLSGLLILVGAVAMTRYRRMYEIAIFKTLDATRRVMVTTLLLEIAVLGALAGVVGSLGAMALTWGVSRFALQVSWHPLPWVTAAGIGACTALVALVGVLASLGVLRHKPLATLRAE